MVVHVCNSSTWRLRPLGAQTGYRTRPCLKKTERERKKREKPVDKKSKLYVHMHRTKYDWRRAR
jgi:hypothetical protein